MPIKRVSIRKIFHQYDQAFDLEEEERVTILFGANGTAKTTTLQLLDALFHRRHEQIASIPFEVFQVTLQTGEVVKVQPDWADVAGKPGTARARSITYSIEQDPSVQTTIIIPDLTREADKVDGLLRRIEPQFQRLEIDLWFNSATQERISFDQAIQKYQLWSVLSPAVSTEDLAWLDAKLPFQGSRFLNVDRLHTEFQASNSRSARAESPASTQLTSRGLGDESISELIRQRIAEARVRYRQAAEILDASFPQRVLQMLTQNRSEVVKLEQIRTHLGGVTQRHERMRMVGLLEADAGYLAGDYRSALQDPATLRMLQVYADDATTKLEAFDEIDDGIQWFTRIVNRRLRDKHISIKGSGIKVQTNLGEELPLSLLSSGEQHTLVMFGEIIFDGPKNGLLLLDEPETSLHVMWQRIFVDDLVPLAQRSEFGFDVILATHSPNIIHGRRNAMRGFDKVEEENA